MTRTAPQPSDYQNVIGVIFGTMIGGWIQKHRLDPEVVTKVRADARMYIEAMAPTTKWHPTIVTYLEAVLEQVLAKIDIFLPAMNEGLAQFDGDPASVDQREVYNAGIVLGKKCAAELERRKKEL